jgi:hypothetical protein
MNNEPSNATGTKEKDDMWILKCRRGQRRAVNDLWSWTGSVKAASKVLRL